jgi:Fur family ferric uptake transcriptional regulator
VTPSDDIALTTHPAAVFGGRRKFRPSTPAGGNARPDIAEANAVARRRLRASRLRPTVTRVAVLVALAQAAPRCLDAAQLMRALIPRCERLSLATVYRALSDLWGAGLLLRSWGQQGRAYYGFKPDESSLPQDTLSCQCGKQMVLIGNRALHEQLRSLAGAAGFDTGKESTFAISVACAGCGNSEIGR